MHFSLIKRRQVETNFSGGDNSSDVGALFLSQVDLNLGLNRSVAKAIGDQLYQASCRHPVEALLKQRIYALALGYEDLNDHLALSHELASLTAVTSHEGLSSTSTLRRFECNAERASVAASH